MHGREYLANFKNLSEESKSEIIFCCSYQRLYFRNANHPIARPSVITRREGRGTASSQSRTDDEGIKRDVDRRFVFVQIIAISNSHLSVCLS
jgi:hypothetical protein